MDNVRSLGFHQDQTNLCASVCRLVLSIGTRTEDGIIDRSTAPGLGLSLVVPSPWSTQAAKKKIAALSLCLCSSARRLGCGRGLPPLCHASRRSSCAGWMDASPRFDRSCAGHMDGVCSPLFLNFGTRLWLAGAYRALCTALEQNPMRASALTNNEE